MQEEKGRTDGQCDKRYRQSGRRDKCGEGLVRSSLRIGTLDIIGTAHEDIPVVETF